MITQCERCGIDSDDPRAQQACAAVDSDSPYHRFPPVDHEAIAAKFDQLAEALEEAGQPRDTCPKCKKLAVLSDELERSVIFYEPLCAACRESEIRELSMDDFDRAYERARANGWAD